MRVPSFIGPTYSTRSRLADNQRCVNLFPERIESGAGQNEWVYYVTPGRTSRWSLPDQPMHRLYTQNGRVFALAGTSFYELFGGGSYVKHGTVAAPSRKPTMAANGLGGNQLFIVSGAKGYIFALDTNTLTEISASGFSADVAQGAFADGYFLALIRGSLSFQISDLFDGLTWDGADLGTRSQQTDNLLTFLVDHQYLWLMGSQTSEVWYNSGAVAFPYQPVSDVFLEVGIDAPDSLVPFDGSVAWIGSDKQGARMVFRAEGFNPARISTHAVETAMSQMARTDDAYAFSYQESGHTFLQITFPSANQTWVYDAASQQWHERGTWNTVTGQYEADRASCYAYAFGMHLVGDRLTGTVYEQSLDMYADGDTELRWMRRSPHLSDENRRLVHRRFELRAETGVGLTSGQGSDPQVSLRWSDDGGFNWSNAHTRSLGAIGARKDRVFWNNLGMARDRVYEVSGSDPVKTALIDAYVTVEGGVN